MRPGSQVAVVGLVVVVVGLPVVAAARAGVVFFAVLPVASHGRRGRSRPFSPGGQTTKNSTRAQNNNEVSTCMYRRRETGVKWGCSVHEELTVSPASVELGEMFTTNDTKLFPDNVGCNNRVNLLNVEK